MILGLHRANERPQYHITLQRRHSLAGHKPRIRPDIYRMTSLLIEMMIDIFMTFKPIMELQVIQNNTQVKHISIN